MARKVSAPVLDSRPARGEQALVRARAAAELGRIAEAVALRYLRAQGLQIVARNFRRRLGEIDLIARDQDVLVIVEVRTRSSERYGGATASIDARKRARIIRAARLLLQTCPEYGRCPVRFDAVIVYDAREENPRVHWIKHAFQAN